MFFAALLVTLLLDAYCLNSQVICSKYQTSADAAPGYGLDIDIYCSDTERMAHLSLLQVKPPTPVQATVALTAGPAAQGRPRWGANGPAAAALQWQPAESSANSSLAGQPSVVHVTLANLPSQTWPPQRHTSQARMVKRSQIMALLQVSCSKIISEGNTFKGLIFATVCLVIILIMCLLGSGDWLLGNAENTLKMQQTSSNPQPSSMLGQPSPIEKALFALPKGPTADPRGPMGRALAFGDRPVELPMVYPQLVNPTALTQLAIPVEPLAQPHFTVDVLRLSGAPLLRAACLESAGCRNIRIFLHRTGVLVAVVTSGLELRDAEGAGVGKIVRDSGFSDAVRYVLQDGLGRPVLTLNGMEKDSWVFKMTSIAGDRTVDHATAVRRPRGKLPAEHYELVANPNVDAVLALACFLAVAVFHLDSKGKAL